MIDAISIVIPAFNEESAIQGVIAEVRELLERRGMVVEFVVVDDGSSDQTGARARAAGARVVRHRSNRGYGAALKTGVAVATHDILAITDADGTYAAGALLPL